MTFKFIIGALFFYLLIRFVFRFVLPVFRVARQANRAMAEMKSKMQEAQQQAQRPEPSQRQSVSSNEGEYIDYEEIKK